MKPVAKGFLIGCSILLVGGIVAVVAVMWFLKSRTEDWVAKGKTVRAEAASYGRAVGEAACVHEAMRRYRAKAGIVGGIEQRVWLSGCLDVSGFEAGFCDGVPPETEILHSATWRTNRCAGLGFSGDPTCPNILAEVQTYCYGVVRKKKQPGSSSRTTPGSGASRRAA